MSLISLPLELLLNIFRSLRIPDIYALRCTCKAFLEVTRERSVWFDACYRHVAEGKIPAPGFNMETITQMSSDELEKSIQRAWLYRRNWTSPSPQPTRRTDIPPPTVPEDLKICRGLSAAFIPGHGGRYLIAFSRLELHNRTRMFVLECWDLRPHRPRRVATYTCKDALNYTVNSDGTHPVVVAVTRRGNDGPVTYGLSINFDALDPAEGFRLGSPFSSSLVALKLEGSAFFSTDPTHCIRSYDITSGQLRYTLRTPLIHDDPTTIVDAHRCIAIHIMGNFVLTFCQQNIFLYALPRSWKTNTIHTSNPELDPVAKYHWQYPIDDLKIVPQRSPFSSFSSQPPQRDTPTPICILMRFESWFPWPVNILHQFILPANQFFDPAVYAAQPDITAGELPYLQSLRLTSLEPYIAHSISSSIRLFTPHDMIVGPYGTALWLDAQTDNISQAGDHGQRIAGNVLRFIPQPADSGMVRSPSHAVDLRMPGDPNENGDEPGTGEGERRNEMVFHATDDTEEWSRLTVDEDEGQIAVSCIDGRVLVYDYT